LALLAARLAWGGGAREFLIQNWTRENGLPGNTVTAVTQTPDGYLWVGTLGGLARFDGVRFVGVDLRKLAEVRDAGVACLQTDQQGTLWIGTGDGHLVRYREGRFTAYLPPSRQTADRVLQRLAEARDGALWMLNYEGGLHVLAEGAVRETVNRPDLVTLASDRARRVWIAARNELLVSEGGQLVSRWNSVEEPGFQPQALAPARKGGCWVVGNGSVRRFEGREPLERYAVPQGKQSAPTALVEDREGDLWLATYGSGVMIFGSAGPTKLLTRAQGLPSDLVRCLFEDQEGDIWAGLEGRGLVCIRRAMFASYGRAEGLSGETVLCMCEDKDGEVWIGTNGDGVYQIKDQQILHYGLSEGLANQFVWALHQDRAGVVWAGTWGGGLFRFENGRFAGASQAMGDSQVVLALHEDARGTLWLGERIAAERRITAVERGQRRSFEVPGNWPRIDVRAIAETPDGSLWFGTTEDGLIRRKNGVFVRYDAKQGLPPGAISVLHVDQTGALWAAVVGVGLVLYENERFVPITAAQGLLDDNLNQITDDGLGYLWCGLKSGVVRVKQEELRRLARGENARLEWRRFTKADGLPSNECSGSGCRARDGRVWFPTATGVAVVDPRHIVADPSPPRVVIEEVLLAGKRIREGTSGADTAAADDRQSPDSNSPPLFHLPQFLRIPPGGGQLDIGYTALSFAAPERVRFRYQLRGLNGSAVEVGGTRAVRYSYLPPGKYEFHVTACNEGGVWNEAGASLAFEVLPHYWQTGWFRTLGIIAFTAGVAGTVGLVMRRRQRRRIEQLEYLRVLERERARIAQDLHDDLGTSLTEINFLSAMAGSPSSSPAEAKHSLASINEKSLELVKALDEIVWAVNPQNDSLSNLINYLCLFAQDYLRPASIQCRLDVPTGLPDLPLNAEQRHTLFLVTKEVLANAAKHSAASEMRLRVALERSVLTLVLEDNGRGFDRATLKGNRNGLKNIETRMRHLGGCATIWGVVGQGTRVELELPLR